MLYHTLRRIGLHFSILSRVIPTLFPIFYSEYHPEHIWACILSIVYTLLASHPLMFVDSYIYGVLGLFVFYYCVTEFWLVFDFLCIL